MKSPKERLILIVDAKCAKFFHSKSFKMKGEIHLSTIDDFDISHKPQSLHMGGARPSGKQSHMLDPKGDVKNLDRKDFCKKVMQEVQDEFHKNKFEELIVIAGPKVLGEIRAATPKELTTLDIKEIHKDLTHFSKAKIEEYLKSVS